MYCSTSKLGSRDLGSHNDQRRLWECRRYIVTLSSPHSYHRSLPGTYLAVKRLQRQRDMPGCSDNGNLALHDND